MRKALVLSLSIALGFGPAASPSAHATQSGAFSNAAGSNDMAANLSKAISVVSMAAGGLFIAKGVQQLTCCSSGCTGSGAASKATKDKIDSDAKKKGSDITDRPNYRLPSERIPDGAQNCVPFNQRFPLLQLFAPPQAQAAIGSCLDAMIALATGGLMLLNGMLGMQAANQAGQNADQMGNTMGSMNSSYPATGFSSTGQNTPERTTSSTGSTGSSQLVQIDPALLRTGTANDIMSQFENKFGINRDKFANAVSNGEDPRKLLNGAPKNPITNADLNKATNGAKGLSGDQKDKADALAGQTLSGLQAELLAKMNKDEFAINASAGSSGSGGKLKKVASTEEGAELDSVAPAVPEEMNLSPEVQAALAAKEKEDRLNGITNLTLFEVVRQKYRDVSKMIFGYDPDGAAKGGTNAKRN